MNEQEIKIVRMFVEELIDGLFPISCSCGRIIECLNKKQYKDNLMKALIETLKENGLLEVTYN